MKRLALLAVLPLLLGATLPERAVEEAGKYLHVREATNRNDHPQIDRWLAYCGIPKGNPYCAAFVVCMYGDVAAGKNPLPRYARVSMLYQAARANEARYKVIHPEDITAGLEKFRPGDIPIWLYGSGPNPNGHTGLARGQKSRHLLLTREANTQPGNRGDQREGGGVYDRERATSGLAAVIRLR
jgi:hypothetical protein